MARANVPFLSFNRGLVSPKALARVDIDRTRLSAEVHRNFISATQGSMSIRPGTKYRGSSLNDTGAAWVEFVSATDDVALCEITDEKMRVWIGDDAHSLTLLGRPKVDTTLSLTDTGWEEDSIGGQVSTTTTDLIPTMTSATTNGVTLTASAERGSLNLVWKIADDDIDTNWVDAEAGGSELPSWFNVDFGSGNGKTISSYSLRAASGPPFLDNMSKTWRLLGSDHDTGTYATDTGKWALEDSRSSETGWAVSEKRTYSLTDTGTADAWRHWRLYITALNGDTECFISEFELFAAPNDTGGQTNLQDGKLLLNAAAIGAIARARKQVVVDTGDLAVEHSLVAHIERGPVTLRVGSSQSNDDYINETSLGTGHHNLAFTPNTNFHVTLQTEQDVNRIVESLSIGDSGTVEVTAPWDATNLDDIRYDQSADVVYLDCLGIPPHKIERRGTGRSWSVVEYEPDDGPFFGVNTSSANLSVSHFYGNTTMATDIPFFRPGHVGALVRAFHSGQSGEWALGALNAKTDPVKVIGINDTGTITVDNERRITFDVSGTWAGEITIERSFDGPDFGFKKASSGSGGVSGNITDTGTYTTTIDDPDDNVQVWYRAKITSYTSGVPIVKITHNTGGVTGVARITDYNSNTSVDVEVLSRFSDTGPTDNWQEGYWSDVQGFPTSVALHGGRLAHAGGANLFLSVSDNYESFDQNVIGDAGPIIRTLGSGPVDNVFYLVSLLRLVIGTAGAEVAVRSSSLDEPLTPDNSSAQPFSTQGSANLRAVKLDTQAVFIQRSKQRVFLVGFGLKNSTSIGDYENFELTLLVPDLLAAGVTSVAVQRQPDTRIHVVLADGTVAILTYEPQEEVICWTTWETDGAVERAMILPGVAEDAVYYHIRRTINGQTKRYLEKWALESECQGDTGLSWLMDCAASYTDTGRATTITGLSHLAGANVVVWADDTGQANAGKDLSPGTGASQTTYAVDTGAGSITLNEAVHHAVAGLPYTADWKSTKLAYAAQFGTALAQYKRVPQIGLLLYQTHNMGLLAGGDTGHLDDLPRVIEGEIVDADKIHASIDMFAMPFDGTWDEDSRIHLRASAPRPVTVLACVPTVETSEKN